MLETKTNPNLGFYIGAILGGLAVSPIWLLIYLWLTGR